MSLAGADLLRSDAFGAIVAGKGWNICRIYMNDRVYDPVVGRFLSPDPFMQAPGYSQGLNRYSYCLNNPLSLTDPGGYSWLGDNWRSLMAGTVGITVAILTAGTGTAGSIALGQAILSGAAGGFTGSLPYLNLVRQEVLWLSPFGGTGRGP